MRIEKLKLNPEIYTGNSYYIRGNYNKIDDVNTLIDTGTDDFVVKALQDINQGVGKKKVDLVILTHEHFDHSGGLKYIRQNAIMGVQVLAFTKNPNINPDIIAYDGMKVKIGDSMATILHTPAHSNDSICILFEDKKILFSGDLTLDIHTKDFTYSDDFKIILNNFLSLNLEAIYPGHGEPIFTNAKIQPMLKETYYNVTHPKN
jgi:glyoxylase-like metal-dependent hydrolase (beta-lactamase superfamily II)